MEKKEIKKKDEIFKQKQEQSLTAVSFLKALKANLEADTVFKVATEAFTCYMTALYEKVLDSTEKYSQKRFDRFREFYENYAHDTPYLEIIESSHTTLKVKYNRCPFVEILEDADLKELGYTFCLSDPAFTKEVLPGVIFSREHEIARGANFCDHTWRIASIQNE